MEIDILQDAETQIQNLLSIFQKEINICSSHSEPEIHILFRESINR